jgi:hypothetical protein
MRNPGGPTRPLIRTAALLAIASLGAAAPAIAQEWRDFRAARQSEGFASLDAEIVYGIGRLTITRSAQPFLYDVHMRYDAERFAPVRSWNVESDQGRLRIALTSAGTPDEDDRHVKVHLDDFDLDLDFDDLTRLGDSDGRLALELHPGIPTDLRIRAGASENRLELGGLSLSSLDLATGASSTRLSFDDANLRRMSQLTLKAGAAEFQAEKLGNARFDHLSFHGGIGEVTLDFTGTWEQSATASIVMKLGELKLRLPSDLGIRIRRRSLFLAFDAEGFTQVGDAYETANWDTADTRLEIELDAAVGAVRVDLVP